MIVEPGSEKIPHLTDYEVHNAHSIGRQFVVPLEGRGNLNATFTIVELQSLDDPTYHRPNNRQIMASIHALAITTPITNHELCPSAIPFRILEAKLGTIKIQITIIILPDQLDQHQLHTPGDADIHRLFQLLASAYPLR